MFRRQPSPRRPVPAGPRRRRLVTVAFAFVAFVAVLAAVMVGAGWWVRNKVEATVSKRITQEISGSEASVSISSFPFLVHLAASGTVEEMSAHVKQLSAGPFAYQGVHVQAATFDDVDIRVDGLRLRRSDLLSRKVSIASVRRATITATLLQASLDRTVGLPVTLGRGSVGLGGLSLPAQVTVQSRQITVTAPNQLSFSFTPPPLEVFPCVGHVAIQPGVLRISCTVKHLPQVLANTAFRF